MLYFLIKKAWVNIMSYLNKNWKTIIGIIGFLITCFSFLFGLYQYKQSKNLEELVRKRAWAQYKRIDATHGEVQFAIKKYKDIYKDKLNPDLLEIFGKADGLGYGIVNASIEQLDYYEDFTLEKVDRWIANKRINPTHKIYFEPLCER
jgi:hypothetical protein